MSLRIGMRKELAAATTTAGCGTLLRDFESPLTVLEAGIFPRAETGPPFVPRTGRAAHAGTSIHAVCTKSAPMLTDLLPMMESVSIHRVTSPIDRPCPLAEA